MSCADHAISVILVYMSCTYNAELSRVKSVSEREFCEIITTVATGLALCAMAASVFTASESSKFKHVKLHLARSLNGFVIPGVKACPNK